MMGMSVSKKMTRMQLGEMSPEDKRKSLYGDKKQGDKLVDKKYATPSYHASSKAQKLLGR